jgi:hypothetical protein
LPGQAVFSTLRLAWTAGQAVFSTLGGGSATPVRKLLVDVCVEPYALLLHTLGNFTAMQPESY